MTSTDASPYLGVQFAALTGVRSKNEILPLEQAQAAYDRMISGKARFRVVLTTQA